MMSKIIFTCVKHKYTNTGYEKVPYWTKFTLGLTCDDFTLSLGPLEANIYAFSGGLSEND